VSILGTLLADIVQGESLQATLGVRFDFSTGTRRVWKGNGPLTDGLGHTWEGVGNIGAISGLQLGLGDVTEPLTFELSGLDASFASVAVDQSTLRGRDCAVYLIVFNPDWTLAENPVSLRTAVMDRMVRKIDSQNRLVSITLTAESFMVTRFRSPNAYLTHADQIARYPGDRGLERISGYTAPAARMLYWY
jgi:hypothetical protein